MRVRVGDVRLWNEFAVREDGGIPITYAAFAVILVGTALRFAFGKQTAACLLEEDGDGIQGRGVVDRRTGWPHGYWTSLSGHTGGRDEERMTTLMTAGCRDRAVLGGRRLVRARRPGRRRRARVQEGSRLRVVVAR